MGISAERRGKPAASVNAIAPSSICTFVDNDVGCNTELEGAAAPPRIGPDFGFDKPRATRTRISVGAMPCEISFLQHDSRYDRRKRITHVDLHGDHSGNALRRVSGREEDYPSELHGQIEHAALDDDVDHSPACPYREPRAMHVARLAGGEVPDA